MFNTNWIRLSRLPDALFRLLVPALMLGSCARSTELVVAPTLSTLPPDPLLQACDRPHFISKAIRSGPSIVRIWGQDRGSLFDCAERQAALAQYMRAMVKPDSHSPDIQQMPDMFSK